MRIVGKKRKCFFFITFILFSGSEFTLGYCLESGIRNEQKSKAPVSQLVNAYDTSVIEIKTQLYLES